MTKLTEVSSSVPPSGSACATAMAPMAPPAPGRLSTKTGVLRETESFCPSARANRSLLPPGENGTTILMILGMRTSWASAEAPMPSVAAASKAIRMTSFKVVSSK